MRFYPFAELNSGDDFVFHPRHGTTQLVSVFYKKVDRVTYENAETGKQYTLSDTEICATWVSKIETHIV